MIKLRLLQLKFYSVYALGKSLSYIVGMIFLSRSRMIEFSDKFTDSLNHLGEEIENKLNGSDGYE